MRSMDKQHCLESSLYAYMLGSCQLVDKHFGRYLCSTQHCAGVASLPVGFGALFSLHWLADLISCDQSLSWLCINTASLCKIMGLCRHLQLAAVHRGLSMSAQVVQVAVSTDRFLCHFVNCINCPLPISCLQSITGLLTHSPPPCCRPCHSGYNLQ